MSVGNFPESLSQGILAGIILVWRLEALEDRPKRFLAAPRQSQSLDGEGGAPWRSRPDYDII